MDSTRIIHTFDLLTLVAQDDELKPVGAYHVGPCPFCGGTDRFTVKHTPRGDRWYCRKCGDGKYHTVIGYVMRRDHLDFAAAVAKLGGSTEQGARPENRRRPDKHPLALPDPKWQTAALREVAMAGDRLLGPQGSVGRQYLLHRGLHRGTWQAWNIGLADAYDPVMHCRRPAIVLPWLDIDQQHVTIMAVKFRFIDGQPNGIRYSSRKGSVPLMFGLWGTLQQHGTLLLVEGEINALSVWQCLPSGVSCLSFGSETGARPEILQWLARRHKRVFVWADDGDKATAMRRSLGREATAVRSPIYSDVKWDANKMLQEGLLMDFLNKLLDAPCLGWCPNHNSPVGPAPSAPGSLGECPQKMIISTSLKAGTAQFRGTDDG